MNRARALALGLLLPFLLASTPEVSLRHPSLVVIVAVDGLSWDRLHAWRAAFDSGFATLLKEGHVATQARYAHLNTETCPGHAALSTGASPRMTGIVGNRWVEQGKRVPCVQDIGPGGDERAGPGKLAVDGLGDVLGPGARVVSISGKDRAAIMLSGRGREHAVFWYDSGANRFTTSAAYDAKVPAVAAVQAIVDRMGPPKNLGAWNRLPGSPKVAVVPRERLRRAQVPSAGPEFPHRSADLFDTPFLDTAIADLALRVLDDPALKLGRSGGTDLLALSFSASDIAAHDYGDGSEEQLEVLRRLDRQLGRVLDALRRRPPGSVLLALSADHGFLAADGPAPRRLQLDGSGLTALNAALSTRLCLPPDAKPVLGMTTWHLYFDPLLRGRKTGPACGPQRDVEAALRKEVPQAFQAVFPGAVAAVVDPSSTPPVALASFVANSRFPGRSGDLLVFPEPGVMSGGNADRGWGHGTQFAYDTHVPLIFWGGAVPAGCSEVPSAPYDLAPTLADYAGVKLPKATGTSLRAEIARGAGRTCR